VSLQNIPHVRDIITMAKLLAHMRCRVESPDLPPSEFTIQAETVSHREAPYELVKTMRASVLTLGPLVARFGYARVSLPGGCAIGARPIDIHIEALAKLGAQISMEHGYVEARAKRLRGATFRFPKITVTGTENILTAAVLAEGETILENSALEPEVTDLAELLIKMGAKIDGLGTSTLRIQGVAKLHGASHSIIPDRIETGTFLVAGAITGGELLLTHCEPQHLAAVINKLRECGVEIKCEGNGALRVRAAKKLVAADVTTEEYPGFATDMQAQFMARIATCTRAKWRAWARISWWTATLHPSPARLRSVAPRSPHPTCARAPASFSPGSSRTTLPGSTACTTSTAATSASKTSSARSAQASSASPAPAPNNPRDRSKNEKGRRYFRLPLIPM